MISLAGTFELLRCVNVMPKYVISIPSMFVAFIIPLLYRYISSQAIILVVVVYLFWLLYSSVFSRKDHPTAAISLAFFCTVYVTISFTSILITRSLPYGEILYLMIFIAAWSTDTFAYFIGNFFGKHKLIPEISPKKTVEGTIGGIVFCSLAFIVYGYIISNLIMKSNVEPSYILLGLAGVAVSLVAQLGDLSASAIKRNYDAKDFGSIFPGHGGIIDRFDSVMAVAPVIMLISSVLLKFENYDLFK
jgi:phosphatidate cytidylyltransferase